MNKQEFEALVGQGVSAIDYAVIEKVYAFHPVIRETSGEEEVAELYKSFGLSIFCDMLPRAEKNCELERKLRQVQAEGERIRQEMKELACGSFPEKEEAAMEAQEKHRIKRMFKEMEETFTGYLRDPQITKACKRRMKLCMIKSIEEIYTRITMKGGDK